jgi:hypothetical protein
LAKQAVNGNGNGERGSISVDEILNGAFGVGEQVSVEPEHASAGQAP